MNFVTYLIKPKKNKQTNKQTNVTKVWNLYKSHASHELMVRKIVIKALHKKAILRIEFVLRGSAPYIQGNEMAFRPD